MKILDKSKVELKEINFDLVEVGKTKTLNYLIYNDEDCEISDIKVTTESKEVTIASPKILGPFETDKIDFSWTPSLDIKKGLKTKFTIEATQIWKP